MIHISKRIIKRAFRTLGLEVTRIAPAPPPPALPPEEVLARLDDPFRSALLSMYNGEPQRGVEGLLHPIDRTTCISPRQGIWLYEFCLSTRPQTTLEIGMAYGYSTLYFLAAATKNQTGHHTAIDPFQRSSYGGVGLAHAGKYAPKGGEAPAFRFIEERSDRAATDLARESRRYDLVFIDGSHRFDDVLVDFCLYGQICTTGGYVVFHDLWMRSVRTAVEFVRTNRTDFVELPCPEPHIRLFQRVGDDRREWDHFRTFKVSPSSDR